MTEAKDFDDYLHLYGWVDETKHKTSYVSSTGTIFQFMVGAGLAFVPALVYMHEVWLYCLGWSYECDAELLSSLQSIISSGQATSINLFRLGP